LAASLDTLALNPVRKGLGLRDVFRFCLSELDAGDLEGLRRLFLFNDIKNIVYLHFRQRIRQGDYLYPAYYLEEQYHLCRQDPLLAFEFIQRWWALKDAGVRHLPNLPETDVLTTLFYETLEDLIPSGFLREWYRFELELRNFTVALTLETDHTDAQGLEVKEKLIPLGWVYEQVCQGARADKEVGRNMGWPDRIRAAKDDLRRCELACEEARWSWLDESLGSEWCSADAVYAYLIRLWSVERTQPRNPPRPESR
jgi:hypothetical protein